MIILQVLISGHVFAKLVQCSMVSVASSDRNLIGNASEIVPGVATGSSRQNGRGKEGCEILRDENAGVLTNFILIHACDKCYKVLDVMCPCIF